MLPRLVPVTDMKRHAARILDALRQDQAPMVITEHGRAAAVLLDVATYEAQAAIELEGIAVDEPDDVPGYAMDFAVGDWAAREPLRISATRLWRELLDDLRAGTSKALIAARFHAVVAAKFTRTAVLARNATGVNQVALSGGCMHNRRLARLLRSGLETEGFEVYQHRNVSPGDGGLSYGQIAVAAATLSQPQLSGDAH